MHNLFDRRLTDPTAGEVTGALRECVAVVNANGAAGDLSELDESTAGGIGLDVLRNPTGRCALFGGGEATLLTDAPIGRLALAWWTNPGGRKLVRVRGWREPDRRGPQYSPELHAFHAAERDRAKRPAVWHLDPERVVETFTAGDPEWVAVCGCGAAGGAESLGWHHGMCGPCADRVAEFGPEAVARAPGLLAAENFEPRDVLFTPDGKFVVARGIDSFRVWCAATGAAFPARYCPERDLEAAPFVLACGDDDFLFFPDSAGGSLDPLPGSECSGFESELADVRAVHATGRPGELLFQTADRALCLMSAEEARTRPVERPFDHNARLCAVHPDAAAPRVALADDHRAAVATVDPDGALIREARFVLGNGRLNRTGVWAGGPRIVRFSPDGERLLFVRGTEMELRLPGRAKALQQVEFGQPIIDAAFAPDGERVYLLTDDGAIHVAALGVLSSVRARLRWHVEPATRMAVSPGGRALATVGPEGVKLWPVASLLPLLE